MMISQTRIAALVLALGILISGRGLLAADDDASSASPTFYKDIQPILQANCQDCHRPAGASLMGMVAPMAFRTYAEVRPWAKSIATQVKSKSMPPWHASSEFNGVFKNERTLTDEEIATIVRWAATGAPRGPSSSSPEAADAPEATPWSIGEPDLIIPFDEPFFVNDDAQDLYQIISVQITEEQLPEDRWIQAMEFRPGSEAVHHIVIFTNNARNSIGFAQGMLGGMGPGTDPTIFPEGYGRRLYKGSTITFNMHYHKESGPGTGMWDLSEIGFKFQAKPVHHNVSWGAIGTMAFEVPPLHSHWQVGAALTFEHDTTLLALFPHMHIRGGASRYLAIYPDGSEEILLDVPNYDFNWQTNYIFNEPKNIPAGTRIEVSMWFNNSSEKGDWAGFNAARPVRYGGPTTDEMMFGWIDYTATEPMEAQGDLASGTD